MALAGEVEIVANITIHLNAYLVQFHHGNLQIVPQENYNISTMLQSDYDCDKTKIIKNSSSQLTTQDSKKAVCVSLTKA